MRIHTTDAIYEVRDTGDYLEVEIIAMDGKTQAELANTDILRTREITAHVGERASFGGVHASTVVKVEE